MKISLKSKVLGFIIAAVLLSGNVSAAIPEGYYKNLEGLSGVTLKKAVKNAARTHTAISYGSASWEVFLESDTRIIGSQRCWWDMYSSNNVAAPNASAHPGMNIEHGVPNSWWGKTQNDAYKDLFHLNPSNSDANSRKGNYPLAEISTQTWSNGVTFIGHPKSGMGDDASLVYEPADEYKGDFARAYFYMFTIYDDIAWTGNWDWMYNTSSDLLLKPWAYEMLLRWAKEDPVSQKEIDRNEAIYRHQKNRNPFIDYPELAEHIWGSKKNQPFHLDGSTAPEPDPDPTPGPGPDPTPAPAGYWVAATSISELNEQDLYIIVSTESHVAMSTATGGSGTVSYFRGCSKSPGIDASVNPVRISSIPDDAAILKLSRSGADWIISVSDNNGKLLGYLQSTETKKVKLSSNPTASGTSANITTTANKTLISFGTADGTLQWNNNDNGMRFTTYTSTLEPVLLYRQEEVKSDTPTGIATGLPENSDEIIIGIYDVNGRKMAAESVSELENGIYIVISNFGTKKIIKSIF